MNSFKKQNNNNKKTFLIEFLTGVEVMSGLLWTTPDLIQRCAQARNE